MAFPSTAWVLVIEDVRDQADLWSDICANAGLNSTTAATGIAGFRRACETRPAVILLDLMLPDVDGWEVCRQLRADDRTKNIPIVILTARDEPQGRRRAEQAGCAAYLTKPCPPIELIGVLTRVLRRQQAV